MFRLCTRCRRRRRGHAGFLGFVAHQNPAADERRRGALRAEVACGDLSLGTAVGRVAGRRRSLACPCVPLLQVVQGLEIFYGVVLAKLDSFSGRLQGLGLLSLSARIFSVLSWTAPG